MKYTFTILFIALLTHTAISQGEYEAEEFVSNIDLKFAVKEMQKSKYIGTAIACERESPEMCDSAENILFEKLQGRISLPVKTFTGIQHYTIDSTEIMSSKNPQINRLIIDTKPGEEVVCSQDGEVTSIFNIPGNEIVVMVKHGSYRTVYGSLANSTVKVGDWISKGMTIGTVAEIDNGKMVFEIWKSNNGINRTLPIVNWIELN